MGLSDEQFTAYQRTETLIYERAAQLKEQVGHESFAGVFII
jgi:hypothetical protein